MSTLISPESILRLLNKDKEWLLKQERSLERDHIECIINNLISKVRKEGEK